jgi:hypothetical protein
MRTNALLDSEVRSFLPDEYFEFKSKIHDRLLDLIDLSKLDRVDPIFLKPELSKVVDRVLKENLDAMPLNAPRGSACCLKSWTKSWVSGPSSRCSRTPRFRTSL